MKPKLIIASQKGVALVIVLGLLVLILGLAVTFLNRTSVERSAAASYAATAATRQLADTAVNFVQGQIHTATSQGSSVAWTSQPGMIRNFDTSGNLTRAYKLYSSDNLIATSTANLTTSDIPPVAWATDTAVWSDLNAPVTADGTANFPILDPGAIGRVDGFAINATTQPAGTSPTTIPMPVRWLYVLQDGTLAAASGTGNSATITGGTTANPIVGRIAFWTDDESCKLNLNTASEGTYWESPTTSYTVPDMAAGLTQPAQNEFQRYPGHPATVSLAPVFWQKFGLPDPAATLDPLLVPQLPPQNMVFNLPSYAATYYQNIYNLIPRVVQGGSTQGTRTTTTNTGIARSALDADRLYTSVDEALFNAVRGNSTLDKAFLEQSKFFLTTSSKAPEVNAFGAPRVTIWPMHVNLARRTPRDGLIAFCSTLNGLPYHFTRSDPSSPTVDFTARNQSVYNYLINLTGRTIPGAVSPATGSFSGKYGPSTTAQVTTQIYDYIRSCINLMDSSGPTTSLASRFQFSYTPPPTANMNALVPGSGQVAPFIHPTNGTKGFGRFPTVKGAGIVFVALNANQPAELSPGVLNPMHPFLAGPALPNRYPMFPGALPTQCMTHPNLRYSGTVSPFNQLLNQLYTGPALNHDETQMQAYFVLDIVQPAQGYVGRREDFRVRIRGLDTLMANTTNLGISSDATQIFTHGSIGSQSREQGYTFGVGNMVGGKWLVASPPASDRFPFFGVPITVSGSTFSFSGGSQPSGAITVDILTAGGVLVQTLNINLPDGAFPTPLLTPTPPTAGGFALDGTYPPTVVAGLPFAPPRRANTLQNRFQEAVYNDGMSTQFFAAGNNVPPAARNYKETADTIRSVEAVYGDTRLIGAMRTVPASMFLPHTNYATTTRSAHSFRTGAGYIWRGGTLQKLTLAAGDYWITNDHLGTRLLGGTDVNDRNPAAAAPDGNSQVNLANPTFAAIWNAGGDFDNGIPGIPDGPYINKADEGNNSTPLPYWDGWGANQAIGATLFSPNRQIASAVQFGSLPTGVNPSSTGANARPWQTLLFCPNPISSTNHFSLTSAGPRDHNLLDLFSMPVVEPYAISEPFATSGKVNMNYQILPFSYIKRDTALRGVLRSARITAIPNSWIRFYRGTWGEYPGQPGFTWGGAAVQTAQAIASGYNYFRYPINATETLKAFEERFDSNDVFRAASEICDVFLYPGRQPTPSNLSAAATPLVTRATSGSNRDSALQAWWYAGADPKSLTGDNLRERPYNYLYPLLTTKSNTYTTHYRVQSLKKTPNSPAGTWNEATDKVTGEFRGSTTIERYINPNDTTIPDYPTDLSKIDSEPLSTKYKWRVVNTRQFAP